MDQVLVILGPTATGKTELALAIARELDGEIINGDALQIYRGLDIGTAKPTPEMRREVPHHLLDILEPWERFSAGEFVRRARQALGELEERGKLAIIVGGSGLYLRALLEGISPVPRDDEVSRLLNERLVEEGLAVLYAELERCDPETAARLAARDRQRILRALEVALATGRPLSEWLRSQPFGSDPLPAIRIGLTLPRSILYDRIARRVKLMIDQGWVEEVRAILDLGLDPQAPGFQAIGYRQIIRYVTGEWSLEAAVDDIVSATRRYAKRQMTWFRKEKEVRWVQALELPRAIPSLLQELKSLRGSWLNEQA